MVKTASDLEKHPLFKQKQAVDAPVTVGLRNLMAEKGPRLEIMTNVTNEKFVRMVGIGKIYTNIYGSGFVHELVETNERLANALRAMAREQSIKMVEAGGSLPGEYYAPNGKARRWNPVGIAQGAPEDDEGQ